MPSGPAPPTLRKYFFFSGCSRGVASPSAISFTVPRTSLSAALGDFGGMARAGGFRKIGLDAASGKNMPGRIEHAAAAAAAVAGVGVVNQQCVSQIRRHQWSRYSPFVLRDIHSI